MTTLCNYGETRRVDQEILSSKQKEWSCITARIVLEQINSVKKLPLTGIQLFTLEL